jgi:hypothetical protein
MLYHVLICRLHKARWREPCIASVWQSREQAGFMPELRSLLVVKQGTCVVQHTSQLGSSLL